MCAGSSTADRGSWAGVGRRGHIRPGSELVLSQLAKNPPGLTPQLSKQITSVIAFTETESDGTLRRPEECGWPHHHLGAEACTGAVDDLLHLQPGLSGAVEGDLLGDPLGIE